MVVVLLRVYRKVIIRKEIDYVGVPMVIVSVDETIQYCHSGRHSSRE